MPTLRPASAVFGIEGPLSIFSTEFFNIDFIFNMDSLLSIGCTQYSTALTLPKVTAKNDPTMEIEWNIIQTLEEYVICG